MIHSGKINIEVREREEFSITWVAENGEYIHGKRCACTSFHSNGRTLNVKFLDSGEFRKVRRCTITEFAGHEVYL
jgi:hypothetical protein